ncbi:MAG: NAD(P)-dependent oxidoreductase [Rhodopseudomonas palustris]|uniref:NAD(P)-dependent oxidoreductase n=1 Tax=Rhodopseudomonas palustris TaxID=1076 RepID=A0A933S5N0_RHOPL|nr:NAD(P)-dependent oxidoreductase [Rhodopseudomonas palustris]
MSFALIGLGEVGTCFAAELLAQGVALRVGSRPSERARTSAERLGLTLETDPASAVRDADVVLLTVTGDGLRDVVQRIAPALRPTAIVADLTAADPPQVIAAAKLLGANCARFVDVAIMGAVSLHGIRTPLLAAGDMAAEFAAAMNAFGFAVSARAESQVGDASRLKLLRSLFTKGLDALVIESMLAAAALGLEADLIDLLSDYDQRPMREHIRMYLRTHPPHAARRLVEMQAAELQLKALNLPSVVTRAAIERYRRTAELVESRGLPNAPLDADRALAWLLDAEQHRSEN